MKKKIILKRISLRNEWRYAIIFDYDKNLVALVKSINGIRWSQSNECWYAGDDEETLKQILAVFRESADIDISAIVSGAEMEKVSATIPVEPELKNAMAEVINSKIDPYADKAVSSSLIPSELKGSSVIKEEVVKEFDGIKLTLANGAKVWLKYTDNREDEISMSAFSNGGSSLVPTGDLPSAGLVSSAKNSCGIGTFSAQDLRRFLSDKNVYVSPMLSELEEMITREFFKKRF